MMSTKLHASITLGGASVTFWLMVVLLWGQGLLTVILGGVFGFLATLLVLCLLLPAPR